MKKNSFIKRLGAVALAGALAFSPLTSIMSPTVASAAVKPVTGPLLGDPDDSAYQAGASDKFTIAIATSDVYGTDAATEHTLYTVGDQLNGYWTGSGLNPWHFAHTPEGNAVFGGVEFNIYKGDTLQAGGPYAMTTHGTIEIPKSTIVALADGSDYSIRCVDAGDSHFKNSDWQLKFTMNGGRMSVSKGTTNAHNNDITDTMDSRIVDYIHKNGSIGTTGIDGNDFGYYTPPYQQHPFYGQIDFTVNDKEFGDADPGKSQGDANLNGAKFAVFNVSSSTSGYSDATTNRTTAGYIITDRGQDGLDAADRKTFIPAYTEAEVMAAYNAYLHNLALDEDAKTFADYQYGANDYDFDLDKLGVDGHKPIVPATVVTPDAHGKVSIKSLPVGKYLILQVDAGDGYYIDEDFKSVVVMDDIAHDLTNLPKFGSNDGEVTASANQHKVYAASGIVYCPLTATNCAGGAGIFDLSNSASYVATSEYTFAAGAGKATYEFSDGATVDGTSRLKPVADTNIFNAHDTIIRGAETLYLADYDDFNHKTTTPALTLYTVGDKTYYNQIPQGDGELAFNTDATDKTAFKITNDSTLPVNIDGTPVAKNAVVGTYEATLTTGTTTGGVPYELVTIDIPVDALPYGSYLFEQTKFGEGYKAGPASQTLSKFKVRKEDKFSNATNLQTYNGRDYITNQLIDGGELYTVSTVDGNDAAAVDLAVYNISDHYVYVPGAGDSIRYETIKDLYDANIKGQDDLSIEEINLLLQAQTPCATYTNVTPAAAIEKTKSLHYGSYLVVVTKIPEGYDLVTPAYTVDSIDEPPTDLTEDKIKFEVRISPNVAGIETELLEATNKIDSVKVDKEVALCDTVKCDKLLANTQYRVYGLIVNKSTGDLVPGQIATNTFKANGGGDNPAVGNFIMTAPDSVNEAAMADWFAAVKAANLSADITEAADTGLFFITDGEERIKYRTTILAYLKAMNGASNTVDVFFPSMDTRKYEGSTYVAYEYLVPYTANPAAGWNSVKTVAEFEKLIKDIYISRHKSLNDEDQTVYVPSMKITAEASLTHGKMIDPTETVVGTTTVGNLEPGNEYKLVSYLYDQSGAKITASGNADPLSVTETFIAADKTKTCTEKFEGLDPMKYNNQRLTVYSTLYRLVDKNEYELVTKGDADSIGYSANDPEPGVNQVDVKSPTVKTTLTGNNNAKKVDFSDPETPVTLTDKVIYTNLVTGGKYRSVLTLVDSTGTPLLDDEGKVLTATHEFTAAASTQTIKIPIEFIATEIAGQKVIAYNDLYRINTAVIKKVAEEHNLSIELQTVTATVTSNRPTLVTVAKDSNTKSHTLSEGSSVIDTVNGSYLEPNTKYMLVTELAVNGSVFDRVEPIKTAVETDDEGRFTAKATIGGYNASALKGKKLTVYETLYNEKETKIICQHQDAEDENQTLTFGEVTTVACSDKGLKKIPRSTKTTIVDNIHYKGLTSGYTYTITTTAMLAGGGSGTAVGVPVKTNFTAEADEGDVSVKLTLDTTPYAGLDIVMFESITEDYSGAIVLEHKDISDTAQTVTVAGSADDDSESDDESDDSDEDDAYSDGNPEGSGPNGGDPSAADANGTPQTGVDNFFPVYFILAGALFITGVATFVVTRRRKIKFPGNND